ncbi:LysR family substrate-binding domain-containing protein [uncultured Nostoc sp.]|uniref:LysR family substrate-binding domain-containing protein n=1 Tax=uncultured Nostoc sp. TaxID=340711 RepID=UPI0035C9F55A
MYVPGCSTSQNRVAPLEWLREGRMDVGLLHPPVEENRFNCETIFQESLMVALPEAHLLASQSNVCLTSLANEPFILFPRILAPGLYDLIISLCQQAGFSPKVAQEAIQMQTIVSLVAAEMGVAIVPASLQNLQRIGVVYKTLQEPTLKVAIAMIWRNNETSPTVLRLVEIVKQAAQQW